MLTRKIGFGIKGGPLRDFLDFVLSFNIEYSNSPTQTSCFSQWRQAKPGWDADLPAAHRMGYTKSAGFSRRFFICARSAHSRLNDQGSPAAMPGIQRFQLSKGSCKKSPPI
jgi:hypothetical protein